VARPTIDPEHRTQSDSRERDEDHECTQPHLEPRSGSCIDSTPAPSLPLTIVFVECAQVSSSRSDPCGPLSVRSYVATSIVGHTHDQPGGDGPVANYIGRGHLCHIMAGTVTRDQRKELEAPGKLAAACQQARYAGRAPRLGLILGLVELMRLSLVEDPNAQVAVLAL
jgi:hypothetical protein